MKKVLLWIAALALLAFAIDWAVLGLQIANGDCALLPAAYVGAVCWLVAIVCLLLRKFFQKCPFCGKRIAAEGPYCPHCGKRLLPPTE